MAKANDRQKTGRPTKYGPDADRIAREAGLLGTTNDDLARILGVSATTFDRWMTVHASFRGAVKAGREGADEAVAASLYDRATGIGVRETKVFCNFDGEVTTQDIKKNYPPDVAACIWWLKNRRPDLWCDKKVVEHSGEIGGVLRAPPIVTAEQWAVSYTHLTLPTKRIV